MKPLHYDFVLPSFLLCANQLESRTTPFQERVDDVVMPAVDTIPSIDGKIASGDIQMHEHIQQNSKVKATIEDFTFCLHKHYQLPFYLSFVEQRESRTTLHH